MYAKAILSLLISRISVCMLGTYLLTSCKNLFQSRLTNISKLLLITFATLSFSLTSCVFMSALSSTFIVSNAKELSPAKHGSSPSPTLLQLFTLLASWPSFLLRFINHISNAREYLPCALKMSKRTL